MAMTTADHVVFVSAAAAVAAPAAAVAATAAATAMYASATVPITPVTNNVRATETSAVDLGDIPP